MNVGKSRGNSSINNSSAIVKAFKTEKMFKDIQELLSRAVGLRSKKFEVKVNEKLLTLRYR